MKPVAFLDGIGRHAELEGYKDSPDHKIPLYEMADFAQLVIAIGPVLLLIDSKIKDAIEIRKLEESLKDCITIAFDVTEHIKDIDFARNILNKIAPASLKNVVVAGGGALINMATWIVSELNNIHDYIVIPSTHLAVADVAYGSKGNLNTKSGKHKERRYQDPTQIVLCPSLLKDLNDDDIRLGLVETLKHGLLQNQPPFTQVLKQISHPNMQTYELARQTIFAKQDVLAVDKHEQGWQAYILSYGHLHAHALEQASEFSLSHAEAVYIGILCDLAIGGDKKLLSQVFDLCAPLLKKKIHVLENLMHEDLQKHYHVNAKDFMLGGEGRFKILPLPKMGAYANLDQDDPRMVVTFDQIRSCLQQLLYEMENL